MFTNNFNRLFYNILNESKDSIGIYIGRFQPSHIGHFDIIKKGLSENKEFYVVIVEGKKTKFLKKKIF